jgi:hypothetical protein
MRTFWQIVGGSVVAGALLVVGWWLPPCEAPTTTIPTRSTRSSPTSLPALPTSTICSVSPPMIEAGATRWLSLSPSPLCRGPASSIPIFRIMLDPDPRTVPPHKDDFELEDLLAYADDLPYTGVTRGRRLVVIVGQRRAIEIAVGGGQSIRRWSKLKEWLESPTPKARAGVFVELRSWDPRG